MPYCRNCGARVNDTDKFCAKCGTQRTVTSQVQTSRNTVNANALKQVLLSTYTLADSLDAIYPAIRQRGHQLREFHKKDVMCFLMYLAAADGKLSPHEKDFLNILFDQNISEQGYVQLIKDLKIGSEYVKEVPLTIQTSAQIDKSIGSKNPSMKQTAPVFIEFYKSAGQALIACDGHTDIRETQKLNEYLSHLNSIVTGVMISTDTITSINKSPTPSSNDKDLFDRAVETVIDNGLASVSVLQRRLEIGYPRAAQLIDEMEKKHIIGPFEGSNPRKILITKSEWLSRKFASSFTSTDVKTELPAAILPLKSPVSQTTSISQREPRIKPSMYDTLIDKSNEINHKESPTFKTVTEPSSKKTYPAAIYKVGNDIPAGKYKVLSDTRNSSYYSICNDPNGDDIIISDNFINQIYVDIQDGQYLELTNCHAVPIKDAVMFNGTTYSDGEYLVGQEIAPGEYELKANSGEDGYYSLETFAFDGSRIIETNRTFISTANVAPKHGQILVLKGCTLRL